MEVLYWLKEIRFPALDQIMLTVTHLGDEIGFMALALILFWCANKRHAYYMLSVGFLGTITSQFLKLCCRVPRPWTHDPNIAVKEALEGAGGYSFPSGHSQSAVGTFGATAVVAKNKLIRYGAIAIAILVPFTRLYLGVHTLQDVLVGSAIALVFLVLVHPLVYRKDGKYFPWLLGGMLALTVLYLCFVEFYPFPADMDTHNLLSGRENAYTLLGAVAGFIPAYIIDKKWLHFPTKAAWWVQLIKIVVGLAIVLLVKSLLKDPLNSLFGEFAGRSVRYFILLLVAGVGWPCVFKLLPSRENAD